MKLYNENVTQKEAMTETNAYSAIYTKANDAMVKIMAEIDTMVKAVAYEAMVDAMAMDKGYEAMANAYVETYIKAVSYETEAYAKAMAKNHEDITMTKVEVMAKAMIEKNTLKMDSTCEKKI